MRLIQSIVLSFNNMIVDNYLQNDRVQHTFYQVFASILFFFLNAFRPEFPFVFCIALPIPQLDI